MKFGTLHLDAGVRVGKVANDDVSENELIQSPANAQSVLVMFVDDGILVRLVAVTDEIWFDAIDIQASAEPRTPQISLSKLRQWIGDAPFPMFVHHEDGHATLRIPTFGSAIVEIGALAGDRDVSDLPKFSGEDVVTTGAWVKEHLI